VHALAVRNPYRSGLVPARTGERGTTTRFLFAGRLLEQKGVLIALEAYREMPLATRASTEFHVVGDGPLRAQVDLLAGSAGPQVVIHGELPRSEVLELMPRCHVLVLPTESEGFPTVVAEAMDASLAVIATRVGGLPDVLADGTNALFVDRSAASVGAAMARLADDRALAGRMGEANKLLLEQFEPTAVAATYRLALEELAGARDRIR
jgi:glycosyltransferase involved in cell wall biosynthesis